LVVGSSLVSLMMIKQISLSRELNQQQGVLIESEETASTATTYQTAWQKLAMAIYESSRQDPNFAAVLKNANVEIHARPSPISGALNPADSPSPDSTLVPSVPAKAPTNP